MLRKTATTIAVLLPLLSITIWASAAAAQGTAAVGAHAPNVTIIEY